MQLWRDVSLAYIQHFFCYKYTSVKIEVGHVQEIRLNAGVFLSILLKECISHVSFRHDNKSQKELWF